MLKGLERDGFSSKTFSTFFVFVLVESFKATKFSTASVFNKSCCSLAAVTNVSLKFPNRLPRLKLFFIHLVFSLPF